MSEDRLKLTPSWKEKLKDEFAKPYMQTLRDFLIAEKKKGKIIYPPSKEIFSALNLTPFEKVKVVILGQDPYHGPNQAHGLCFSVKPGVPAPPSLQNIYRELADDVGIAPPVHGCLVHWAKQGVLLLNSVLTVERSRAASHQGKGWEEFTDYIVQLLNEKREHLVFLLWGSYAQRKGAHIDQMKHFVLKAPHPSPLSAHRGFSGCHHFSKANEYLELHGQTPIDWQLPATVSAKELTEAVIS